MHALIFAAAAAAALGALPATASAADTKPVTQAPASGGSQDQSIDTATGEKVICRRDKEIGSRVKSRAVCMTAKQWAAKLAEERQFVEQRQAQRTAGDNN